MADGIGIRRNPQVAYRPLASEGEAVLLHLESGQYHGLNAMGSLVWELLDGKRTLDEIVAAIRERVDEPIPDTVESDVVTFLAYLQDRELVIG